MLYRALSGEIAKARGQRGEAVLAFEQAVRMQDALNFNEPPDWPQSMRLYLGAALLEAGRAKDAEGVYREELRDLRDNGWALFGLWQSVRARGRSAEAQEIRERFDRAWKNADVVLRSSIF
jgi:tetratricopeptide (TPR) repeat protein